MSALPTLFKLAERRIEAAASVMRQFQNARDAVLAEQAMLEARIVSEAEMAKHLVGFPDAYGAFLDRARYQIEQLDRRLTGIDGELETARKQVQSAFEERTRIDVLIKREAEKKRLADLNAQDKRLEDSALFRSARLARERTARNVG